MSANSDFIGANGSIAETAEAWRLEQRELVKDPLSAPELPDNTRDFYEALASVRQLKTTDFTGILRVTGNSPVTIHLLDAPLHEFQPPYEMLLALSGNSGASSSRRGSNDPNPWLICLIRSGFTGSQTLLPAQPVEQPLFIADKEQVSSQGILWHRVLP